MISSDLSHQLRAPRALASAAFAPFPGKEICEGRGRTAAGYTVTRPGSHLSSTEKALGGCQHSAGPDLSVAIPGDKPLLPGNKAHSMPLAGLPSQGPRLGQSRGQASCVSKSWALCWPFCSVSCRVGGLPLSRRQISPSTDTANLSQAICAPTAWRKRDLSWPRY